MQRPHKPHELGPRVYRKGRWWCVDLRAWGHGRPTMRNPKAPGWPKAGERTELREVAERWKWAYLDWCHGEHRNRVLGTKPDRTLREAVAEYVEHRTNLRLAASTLRNDRTALAHLALDHPGASVLAVSPQKTLNRLASEGYGTQTLVAYSISLSAFWKWLGLPYPTPTLPRAGRRDVVPLTDAQIVLAREAAEQRGLLLAVDLGLYVGLRIGEMWGAMGEDFDLPSWTMRVRRQRLQSGTIAPLKGRRSRTALILPGWGHDVGPGPLLEPMGYLAMHKAFKAILRAAGIEKMGVRAHILRHTYARLFLEAKPDMRLLQASLGHASVVTTEEAYDSLLPDKAAEIARKAIHGH